eukprot:Skav213702  [mRNA]  locus=scaffold491:756289:757046:+ [translate_table: standard]
MSSPFTSILASCFHSLSTSEVEPARPQAGADWHRFRTGATAGDVSTVLDARDEARDPGAVEGRLDPVDRDPALTLAGRLFLCGSVNSAL